MFRYISTEFTLIFRDNHHNLLIERNYDLYANIHICI